MPKNQQDRLHNAFIDMSNAAEGGVITGSAYFDPTIIAHEIGHKLDKSYFNEIAPSIRSTWTKYSLPLVGAGLGFLADKYLIDSKIPYGQLTNIGVQLASSLPTLVSEHNANKIAKEIYQKADEYKLGRSFNSYLQNTTMKTLPGVIGLGLEQLL